MIINEGTKIVKKIIFMVDMYYPKPRAVGICVHNVAQEMINLGYEVHVIAYKQNNEECEEEFEGVFVHRIAMRLDMKMQEYGESHLDSALGKISYKAAGIIRKIQKLFFLPWFPLVSPLTVNRYYRKTLSLNREYDFDCIIATYLPPEPLFAGAMVKKKLKNIKYGAYILDSLITQSGQKYLPSKLIEKLTWKFEKMIYETADKTYNPECLRDHYQSDKYLKYRDKMIFLDVPYFKPKQPISKQILHDISKKHLVYLGTLIKNSRNPEYIYRLFTEINKSGLYQLHFYTRGSCEDDLLKYQIESGDAVLRHGFVTHAEIDNIIANSDYLINLSVKDAAMISGKIFEYMSTGKPVIHFYYKDNDACLRYLEKYELSIVIKIDEQLFESNVRRLKKFLTESYGKTVEPNSLIETFKGNMPIQSAQHFDALARGDYLED